VSKYWPLQEAVVGRFLWRVNQGSGRNLDQHLKSYVKTLLDPNVETHTYTLPAKQLK
jgi:hypothetical protein